MFPSLIDFSAQLYVTNYHFRPQRVPQMELFVPHSDSPFITQTVNQGVQELMAPQTPPKNAHLREHVRGRRNQWQYHKHLQLSSLPGFSGLSQPSNSSNSSNLLELPDPTKLSGQPKACHQFLQPLMVDFYQLIRVRGTISSAKSRRSSLERFSYSKHSGRWEDSYLFHQLASQIWLTLDFPEKTRSGGQSTFPRYRKKESWQEGVKTPDSGASKIWKGRHED